VVEIRGGGDETASRKRRNEASKLLLGCATRQNIGYITSPCDVYLGNLVQDIHHDAKKIITK
jgi:hypothetical protein